MKTLHILKSFIVLSFFLIPVMVNAGNPDEKQTRQVDSFSAIHVSTGIDLYLEYGSQEKVVVEGANDEINEIITEVKDGTLYIHRKNKFGFNFNFHNNCEVYVTAKTLRELDASSGSEVKTSNQFNGDEIKVRASSGSEVKMDLAYDKVKTDSSSGSEIKLKGKTKELDLSVSSGSEINACELTAVIVHADASSGGDACVKATSELHANASSGGDIHYEGSPGIVDVNKSSGGGVSKN
jgi:hypothetical protein